MNLHDLNLNDIAKLSPNDQREILRMLEEAQQKRELENAKNTFLGYARYMFPQYVSKFVEGRHHREMAKIYDAINRGELKRVIISLAPRHALAVDTEIPTPKGFVKIKDLKLGDHVFGADGKPTMVVGKSEVFKDKPVWRAETDDGVSVRCDGEHLWTVSLDRRYRHAPKTMTTQEIVDYVNSTSEGRKPMLPQHVAVEYPEADLPIGPYTLGLWLGDGACRQAVITSHDDDQPIVRARIESEGHVTTEQSTRMTFGILDIKVKLRDDLNVLGNKHIPTAYLLASVAQRRALLHGLMDSDGNVSKDGQCMFSTSNKAIRDGFWELCHSLGIKASWCVCRAKLNGKDYGEHYRFSFYDDDSCYLPRKRERCRKYIKPVGRYISFKPDGVADTVCIEVDREDGLFLVGRGYIVSHNTKSEFASWLNPSFYFGHHPNHKIIQVSNTAQLAEGFGRRVRDTMEGQSYKDLFGGVTIKSDSRSAGRWNTNKGGDYYATGVGGALAGRGANVLNIDDPHSEADALAGRYNPKIFDDSFEWYGLARQRLQPGGAIVITACIAEGERVLLGNGEWVPIQDIRMGDSVIGYENDLPVQKKVLDTKLSNIDDVYKIKLRSTELRANKDHPLLVVKGGLKSAKLDAADCIVAKEWSLEWVRVGDLQVGDTVVTLKSMAAGKGYRPMAFDGKRQMSASDYWLIGFMFGDGWLASSAARGDVGFCIAKSVYPELNARVLESCEKAFGVTPTETKYGYWRADNKASAAWLRELGFCSGAKTKRLPGWVFKLRPCDKRKFIEGFCEADGWLREGRARKGGRVRTWKVKLANRELLDDLRLLARTCGIKTTKILAREGTVQAPNSPSPIYAYSYECSFTDKSNRVELKTRYTNQGQHELARHFRFEDVEEVVLDGRAPVYDITVEGAESFVAEGVVVHNTRWSKRDLSGQVLAKAMDNGTIDDWKEFKFPVIFEDTGNPLWPEYWSIEELMKVKAEIPPSRWAAQYMQEPVTEGGAIIKRSDWKPWERPTLPAFSYVIDSWDTAFTAKTANNFSARTRWGVFYHPDADGRNKANIMLIDSYRDRLEFPALKTQVKNDYGSGDFVDLILVEGRGSGISLIDELIYAGFPVEAFVPARKAGISNDKVARAVNVADIFRSGVVWYNTNCALNEVTIDECADLPRGENDDLADTTTQAVQHLRDRSFIGSSQDTYQLFEDDELGPVRPSGRIY